MHVQGHCDRVSAIDAGRVFAMLGICILHAVGVCSPDSWWLHRPLNASVVYFVFITGYFGITFRLMKIMRLIAIGAFCAFLSAVFEAEWSLQILVNCGVKNFLGYWFLWAYVVLSILAPAINQIVPISDVDDIRLNGIACGLILFLVFVWNFAVTTFNLRIIPSVIGFGAHTPLTLIGIYTAARVYKTFEETINRKVYGWKICLVVLCIPLILWRCNLYCSPVLLLFVVILFSFVKNIDLSFASGCIAWFLPSLFPVYLLHCTLSGQHLINMLNIRCSFICNPEARAIFIGFTIFIGCVILDCLARRIPIMLIKKVAKNIRLVFVK